MPDVLELIHNFLGDNTSDEALQLMTDVKALMDEKTNESDNNYKSQIETLTKERDDALEREKKVRTDYMNAFLNPQAGAKPTPTSTEDMTPGYNMSLDDWFRS